MMSVASAFAGGTGTAANHYQISNVTQLQAVQSGLSAHYILINNIIDASITSTWNSGVGFVPITTFTGSFDGQDIVISDLYINSPLTNNVGLFGHVESGSVIKNVSVVNVQITGQGDVGGIVGYASNNTNQADNQADAGMVLYEMHVNGNELNVTWNDTSRLTSLVEVTIKNRDRSTAYYLNSTDSEGYLLQTVNASENIIYIVELKVHSGGLPETGIHIHMITFTDGARPAFDMGFSAPWQSAFLASLSLIFFAVIFGSVNAYIGAILVSLAGLFHMFVTGWIPASMVTIDIMFIAVIMSLFFYMLKVESRK
ncbi:GLUG domain protein [Methanolobus psychrophilus R15]|nr:GLUG domain protein [Methanolobus psychrophilus R15]